MFENFDKITVSSVKLVMLVPKNSGQSVHKDRAYHGLVINSENSEKNYIFSDGTVLKTVGNDIFYLPKGSNYRVESVIPGDCYAINFDVTENFDSPPFKVNIRDKEAVLKCFKSAEKIWRQRPPYYRSDIFKNIYEIISLMGKEAQKEYISTESKTLITDAVEFIDNNFTDKGLSVAKLSEMCGITEAYFRRLFIAKYGIPPKEYITRLRISYAKRLLKSGEFSVSEVASLSGYSEPCHFSREFSKRVGISPNKYLD